MRFSPIGMPATRPRKAKPVAIRRDSRFRFVFDTRYQTIAATAPMISTCQTRFRKRGSDQLSWNALRGAARLEFIRGSATAPDIGSSRKTGQPATGLGGNATVMLG